MVTRYVVPLQPRCCPTCLTAEARAASLWLKERPNYISQIEIITHVQMSCIMGFPDGICRVLFICHLGPIYRLSAPRLRPKELQVTYKRRAIKSRVTIHFSSELPSSPSFFCEYSRTRESLPSSPPSSPRHSTCFHLSG
jgi:hypothetical protein